MQQQKMETMAAWTLALAAVAVTVGAGLACGWLVYKVAQDIVSVFGG